jgi:octaprenyl-diphosphate synthase
VDDAYERRGFFSINALWKNKIAVLVGDYLLAKGLLLSVDSGAFRILKITSNAVQEMSEGELLQIEKARKLDIKEDIYFQVIRRKTASLIAAACSAGAASTQSDETVIEKMRLFGEKIGVAFQLKDDLLDYGDEDIGKPRGIDIKERKMTLPLIYTLNNVPSKDRRSIINIVKNNNKDNAKVKQVIDRVIEAGGIEYTKEAMYKYREKAIEMLREFPDSASRKSMEELIVFTTERKK